MVHTAANLCLIAAWFALASPGLAWMARGLIAQEGTVHLVVAMGLLALVVSRARGSALHALARPIRSSPLAWCLLLGLPLAARFAPAFNSVNGVVAIGSGFGLLGLFVSVAAWRRCLPLAVVAATVLPVSQHLDVLLGLPLRTFIASVVALLFGTVESGTILEVQGTYAHVDLPCAGVQSLWSAVVVFGIASAVWEKRVDAVWVGLLGSTWALLIAANIARVAALVGLHNQLGWTLVAEVVHTPLGVLAFVAGLAPALLALHHRATPPLPDTPRLDTSPAPLWLALPVLLGLALVPRAPVVIGPAAPHPVLPRAMTEVASTETERAFVEGRGGALVKARFERGAVRGSVAVISSRSWVTQHVPELCHASDGWTLLADHPERVGQTPVRIATLTRGDQTGTALWWFESREQVTDDHTVRIASDLVSDEPWLLVSLFVEGEPTPSNPDLHAVVASLRDAGRQTLEL
jgi:exosortase O